MTTSFLRFGRNTPRVYRLLPLSFGKYPIATEPIHLRPP
jgi:hypothetical protein